MGLSSYLPRNHVDALAMGFTFTMIPVSYLHGVFNITPTLWPLSDEPGGLSPETAGENTFPHYLSVTLMTFLFANTMLNLVLTVTTDTSCSLIAQPVVGQPGWYFCPYCRYYAPPRAHHCPSCRRCVLRRDHHCFFAGKCIGHYNHRYFVSFLAYLTLSAATGVVTSFMAISKVSGGFSLTFIPAFIFPVLAWLFQMMPMNFFVMVEASLAIFITFGAGALLVLQVYMISRGQTYYEFQKNVNLYGRSLAENFADVMGRNWWFCWIFPLIPSPRDGDGAHYPSREDLASATAAAVGTKWNSAGGASVSSSSGAKRKPVKST